jgi:hypothetical protein
MDQVSARWFGWDDRKESPDKPGDVLFGTTNEQTNYLFQAENDFDKEWADIHLNQA